MKDTSATAYFASICSVLQHAQQGRTPDVEVLAYCFAAIISRLDIAVIQNQHAQIYGLIKTVLLTGEASDYTSKYGLMSLQFLLHSKTQSQWQIGADQETEEAMSLMLSFLIDPKKKKSQKQAIKCMCTMLRNRNIDKQPVLTK